MVALLMGFDAGFYTERFVYTLSGERRGREARSNWGTIN